MLWRIAGVVRGSARSHRGVPSRYSAAWVRMLAIPPLVSYAEIFDPLLPGTTDLWLDENGHATLFPIRTIAALAGLVLLGVVSRLTGRWDPPRPIPLPPGAAESSGES